MYKTSTTVLSKIANKTMVFTCLKSERDHQYLPSKTTSINHKTVFPLKNMMSASERESKTIPSECISHLMVRYNCILLTYFCDTHRVMRQVQMWLNSDIPDHLPAFHISEQMQSVGLILPGGTAPPTAFAEAPHAR